MREKGFTLIEILFTVAILAIVMGTAVPALNETIRVNRLHQATEGLYQFLLEAKGQAIRQNQAVYLNSAVITDGRCVGYKIGSPCYCNVGGSCDKVFQDTDYPDVNFDTVSGLAGIPAFQPYGWAPGSWRFELWVTRAPGVALRRAWVTTTKTGIIIKRYTNANML